MGRVRVVAAAIICVALALPAAAAARSLAGDWLVFSASPDGTAPAQLFRVHTDGSGLEQITKGGYPATDPAFAPSGGRLTFARLGVGIFAVNLDGTGLTRLTKGRRDSFPVWSPDGTRIAFLRPTKAAWAVYLVAPSGRGLHRLSRAPSAGRPTWAGKASLYLPTASGVAKVDAKHGEIQKIYNAIPDLAASQAVTLSPNGKTMLYVGQQAPNGPDDCGDSPCQRFALFSVPIAKSKPKQIAAGTGPAGWSPDGKRIAFVAKGALNLSSPTGANRTTLTLSGPQVAMGDAPPAWQP